MALDWPGYIGMVTGIGGLAASFVAVARTKRFKSIELWLELSRAISTASRSSLALHDLLQRARDSRFAVLAARGLDSSGAWEAWDDEIHRAKGKWYQLHKAVGDLGDCLDKPSIDKMVATLAEVHDLQQDLSAMSEKYKAEITRDSETRREIARQHENHPRQSGGHGHTTQT